MSAFALRKKLLAQQSQVTSPSVDEANDAGADLSAGSNRVATSPQKKTRKVRTTRQSSTESKEVSRRSSESPVVQVSTDLPAAPRSEFDQVPRSLSPLSAEEEEEEKCDTNSSAQPANLSSFRPSKTNFRKKKEWTSSVEVGGGREIGDPWELWRPSGIRISWVHAPQSHALPVIRCTDEATLELHPHPSAQGLGDLGKLSPLFRKLWREDPGSLPEEEASGSRETFRILYTSEDGLKRAVLQDLKAPPEWNREMAALVALKDPALSIMITGPKSSGKSTFGKILTNRLLTHTPTHAKKTGNGGIVILDLDPGQPEYCGVGQIALVLVTKPVLSPSFCRPLDGPSIRTIRSHALASLSPASDPQLYIEMALDLITHYRNGFASYPLVINTPGWIQGTGLDLLVSLISELRPSEVVYMSQTGPADAVEAIGGACNATRFSTLPSHPNQNSLRTAVHLRSMQTMAYFHAEPKAQENGGDHFRWFERPLTAVAPWQVRFRGPSRGIFGVLCYDFQTQPDLVADAINGSLLAIVEVESTKAFRDLETHQYLPNDSNDETGPESPMELDLAEGSQAESSPLSLLRDKITTLTSEGIPFIDTSLGLTLDPRYSRSLGLALVRGIDIENGNLHLLCPVTADQVEDVRTRGGQIVLVSGKFDPPSWAYTEDLYFQSEGDDGDGIEGVGLSSSAEGVEVDSEGVKGENATVSDRNARSVPWIEILTRNQKRGAGSKVWRVRRDLGRGGNPAG
ncbi:hypothetical protein EKO27_g8799 [Xylaria grammica]|uniref:Polynucleotide 5'-hydroxyl-kinase GRC3 n=1 Tax=Xylaria grammica TaxID=363999 RepID=A0A439CVS9_9PEZI|nr:hypothetical protein EKO27_g8799 [Xylaria grammica]